MNMELLERNLTAIEENPNHVILPFNEEDNQIFNVIAHQGETTVFKDGKYISYNNSESNNYTKSLTDEKRELYFILSLMDIGVIEDIYNICKASTLFIIEPNPEVFYYMITHYDLVELFNKKNIYLLVADFDNAKHYFNEFLLKKSFILRASNLQFYTSKHLLVFEKNKVLSFQKEWINYVKYSLFTIGNSTHDTMIGLLHNLLNLKTFSKSLSIKKIKDYYKGKPIVIVSAGPSLEKNLKYLKEVNRDSILIFSVDTAYNKLLKIGIYPDAVFTVERPKKVYNYFYKDMDITDKTVFCGIPVVHSDILKKFSCKRMLFALREGEKINKWMNKLVDFGAEELPVGFSCAHIAFAFARYLGGDPIIFIGQDLAYGEKGASHANDTIYDNLKKNEKENNLLYELGYYGEKVKTRRVWKNQALWFEDHFSLAPQLIINATEGGIDLKNTTKLTLKKALTMYSKGQVKPLPELIDELYVPTTTDDNKIKRKIENTIEKINQLINIIEKLDKDLNDIENIIGNANDEHLLDIHKKINQINNRFIDGVTQTDFFEIFIHTHMAISAFETNNIKQDKTKDSAEKVIKIQKKLYKTSKDLATLVASELYKYLQTDFLKI